MRIGAAATLASILLSTSALGAAELNVRKVVLYKHGIGFFERSGAIPQGEKAQLEFKASEMDDVLKSLTVEQRGGDGVSAIRYDSSDPLSKRLEVFPFRVGDATSLSQILDQLKGARVELRMTSGTIQGAIVSARTAPATERQPEHEQLLLLMETGELQNVDPRAAAGLRFVDPKLQAQFQDYLEIVSGSRSLDKRTVTVESSGGVTEVAASYVVPTPIWKTSYRLVFDAQKPLLEGWAIVDNTSGEDWSNVALSLVSGLPVSFISRLYEPRYVQRPVIQLAQDRAWRPTVHGGAIEEARDEALAMAPIAGLPPAPGQAGGIAAGNLLPAEMKEGRAFRQTIAAEAAADMVGSKREDFERRQMYSSVAATAVGAELGELFEYKIEKPVTIRQGESAMLPFLRERVDGRRLLIYDQSNDSQHPLNAVELTNSTGTTMDGGAITVYEAGAYAGEALMETIKSGDKRLVSYAVDLGSRITTAYGSENKLLSEIHFRRGILTTRYAQRETKTFTIRNVDSRPKTVIIEHPVRPEYKLIDMKPAEKTAGAYRFEVPVAAGATQKFPIVEERLYDQQIAVTNLTADQLFSYVRNKDLDPAGRQKLEQVAALKQQIADADQRIQRFEEQIQALIQDQGRLRSNISTLRSVPGQEQKVQEYAETLAAQEGELVSLRDRQMELRNQRDDFQRRLNTLFEEMEF